MTGARGSSALHSLFQRALLKSLTFSRKSHQSLPKTNENCGRWARRYGMVLFTNLRPSSNYFYGAEPGIYSGEMIKPGASPR
jgi:hypothetical protein